MRYSKLKIAYRNFNDRSTVFILIWLFLLMVIDTVEIFQLESNEAKLKYSIKLLTKILMFFMATKTYQ